MIRGPKEEKAEDWGAGGEIEKKMWVGDQRKVGLLCVPWGRIGVSEQRPA